MVNGDRKKKSQTLAKKSTFTTTTIKPTEKELNEILSQVECGKVNVILEDDPIPHGKIVDGYWVWPDGRKTHLRFIGEAIRKIRPLPFGFYKEAERVNMNNLNIMVHAAKQLKLKDTVMEP